METVLIGFGVLAGFLVLGGWRARLSYLVWALFGLVAGVLLSAAASLAKARRLLVRGVDRTRGALAYSVSSGDACAASAWDMIGPIMYGVFGVAIVGGDLILAGLRFGALLNIPIGNLPLDPELLDWLAGVLFVAVIATFGLLLLDVLGVTPTARPFGTTSGSAHRFLRAVAIGGTATAVVAGVLFLVWGQGAIAGSPNLDLGSLFVACFGALLVLASIVAIAGALAVPLVVWLGIQAMTVLTITVVYWLLRLVHAVVAGLNEIVQAVLLVVAWPGEVMWNWLAGRASARAGLTLIPPASPLPPLGGRWSAARRAASPPAPNGTAGS